MLDDNGVPLAAADKTLARFAKRHEATIGRPPQVRFLARVIQAVVGGQVAP